MSTHVEYLRSLNACNDAITWAMGFPSLEAAWHVCQRSDWMIWLLIRTGSWDDATVRRFACRCVRETPLADGQAVWDLLTDERSRHAVVMAERYIDGDATEADLRDAREAAWEAAGEAAGEAAREAAGAAWEAAGEAAGEAAWEAAGEAVGAAAWAAAWAATWAAARAAARAHQADILRAMIDPSVIASLCREKEGS